MAYARGPREVVDQGNQSNVHLRKAASGTIHKHVDNSQFYSKHGILSIQDSDRSSGSMIDKESIKIKKVTKIYDGSTKFPKLEECAHFHYDFVEFGSVKIHVTDDNQENIYKTHEAEKAEALFNLGVECGEKCWTIRRTYENFRELDKQLHRCIFDRKFSMLPELKKNQLTDEGIPRMRKLLSIYLQRFTSIAGNMINCGPVLSWLEMDNRGNRLIVTDDSAINTPAIAAAHVVKRYTAQANDEISLEVGDIISLIDMPPTDETIWWQGKRSFEVGFFPSECVEVIGSKIPTSMTSKIPETPPKPVLRKRGKLISFLRAFFTSRPARTTLKRTGIVKERVFGCDLGEHLLNSGQDVPLVLKCCAEFIESDGIVDGIYRLSGVASNIQKLRNDFDEDRMPDLTEEVYIQDIHSISSLLKMYFRDLPNPLLTYQLYDKFAEAVQDHDNRLNRIHDVIQQLPPPHYRTAEYLFKHLSRVATHGKKTGMHCKNLAIVWAPNLMRSKELEQMCNTAALHGVGVQAIVTEYLINNADLIFSDKLQNAASNRELATVQKKTRPKSLAISTPTKLLSLEEAREHILCAGQLAAHQKYIDVGGGPDNLPEKYHTVIDLPGKKKGGRKSGKSPTSWKSVFSRSGSRTGSWKEDDSSSNRSSLADHSDTISNFTSPTRLSTSSDHHQHALTEDDVAQRRKLRSVRSFETLSSALPNDPPRSSRLSSEEATTIVNLYTDEYQDVRPKTSTGERPKKKYQKRSASADYTAASVDSMENSVTPVSMDSPVLPKYVAPAAAAPLQPIDVQQLSTEPSKTTEQKQKKVKSHSKGKGKAPKPPPENNTPPKTTKTKTKSRSSSGERSTPGSQKKAKTKSKKERKSSDNRPMFTNDEPPNAPSPHGSLHMDTESAQSTATSPSVSSAHSPTSPRKRIKAPKPPTVPETYESDRSRSQFYGDSYDTYDYLKSEAQSRFYADSGLGDYTMPPSMRSYDSSSQGGDELVPMSLKQSPQAQTKRISKLSGSHSDLDMDRHSNSMSGSRGTLTDEEVFNEAAHSQIEKLQNPDLSRDLNFSADTTLEIFPDHYDKPTHTVLDNNMDMFSSQSSAAMTDDTLCPTDMTLSLDSLLRGVSGTEMYASDFDHSFKATGSTNNDQSFTTDTQDESTISDFEQVPHYSSTDTLKKSSDEYEVTKNRRNSGLLETNLDSVETTNMYRYTGDFRDNRPDILVSDSSLAHSTEFDSNPIIFDDSDVVYVDPRDDYEDDLLVTSITPEGSRSPATQEMMSPKYSPSSPVNYGFPSLDHQVLEHKMRQNREPLPHVEDNVIEEAIVMPEVINQSFQEVVYDSTDNCTSVEEGGTITPEPQIEEDHVYYEHARESPSPPLPPPPTEDEMRAPGGAICVDDFPRSVRSFPSVPKVTSPVKVSIQSMGGSDMDISRESSDHFTVSNEIDIAKTNEENSDADILSSGANSYGESYFGDRSSSTSPILNDWKSKNVQERFKTSLGNKMPIEEVAITSRMDETPTEDDTTDTVHESTEDETLHNSLLDNRDTAASETSLIFAMDEVRGMNHGKSDEDMLSVGDDPALHKLSSYENIYSSSDMLSEKEHEEDIVDGNDVEKSQPIPVINNDVIVDSQPTSMSVESEEGGAQSSDDARYDDEKYHKRADFEVRPGVYRKSSPVKRKKSVKELMSRFEKFSKSPESGGGGEVESSPPGVYQRTKVVKLQPKDSQPERDPTPERDDRFDRYSIRSMKPDNPDTLSTSAPINSSSSWMAASDSTDMSDKYGGTLPVRGARQRNSSPCSIKNKIKQFESQSEESLLSSDDALEVNERRLSVSPKSNPATLERSRNKDPEPVVPQRKTSFHIRAAERSEKPKPISDRFRQFENTVNSEPVISSKQSDTGYVSQSWDLTSSSMSYTSSVDSKFDDGRTSESSDNEILKPSQFFPKRQPPVPKPRPSKASDSMFSESVSDSSTTRYSASDNSDNYSSDASVRPKHGIRSRFEPTLHISESNTDSDNKSVSSDKVVILPRTKTTVAVSNTVADRVRNPPRKTVIVESKPQPAERKVVVETKSKTVDKPEPVSSETNDTDNDKPITLSERLKRFENKKPVEQKENVKPSAKAAEYDGGRKGSVKNIWQQFERRSESFRDRDSSDPENRVHGSLDRNASGSPRKNWSNII